VHYVTLTNNCNMKCRYCYGKACEDFGSDFHDLAVDYSLPSSIAYDTETLWKFLQRDRTGRSVLRRRTAASDEQAERDHGSVDGLQIHDSDQWAPAQQVGT